MPPTASTAIPSPSVTSPIFVVARRSVVADGIPAATRWSTVSMTPDSSATPLTRCAAA